MCDYLCTVIVGSLLKWVFKGTIEWGILSPSAHHQRNIMRNCIEKLGFENTKRLHMWDKGWCKSVFVHQFTTWHVWKAENTLCALLQALFWGSEGELQCPCSNKATKTELATSGAERLLVKTISLKKWKVDQRFLPFRDLILARLPVLLLEEKLSEECFL